MIFNFKARGPFWRSKAHLQRWKEKVVWNAIGVVLDFFLEDKIELDSLKLKHIRKNLVNEAQPD